MRSVGQHDHRHEPKSGHWLEALVAVKNAVVEATVAQLIGQSMKWFVQTKFGPRGRQNANRFLLVHGLPLPITPVPERRSARWADDPPD